MRLVAVDDAGTIVNPLLAEGQRHGGFAQGVAQALLEEVLYDEDGNPTTSTLADYPFVSATELPSFELVDMATPTPMNPLGAKGIGEAGTIGSTPAVQNAVIDAVAHLGVRHIDMPTTPMRVWRAIQQAEVRRSAGGQLMQVSITVNGEQRTDEVEPRLLLAHYLREVCGLKATNIGCDSTSCGACTVVVDGLSREELHGARRADRRRRRSPPWRGWPARTASCTRCRPRSAPSTGCSAASAPRAW